MKDMPRKNLSISADEINLDRKNAEMENHNPFLYQEENLEETISSIQLEVSTFCNLQAQNQDHFLAIKQLLSNLSTKVNSVEDQLSELELRSETDLILEKKEFRNILELRQKCHPQEIEESSNKLTVLEQDNKHMVEEITLLKQKIKTLKLEINDALNTSDMANSEIIILQDKNRESEHLHKWLQKEIKHKSELITTLFKELEKKGEAENNSNQYGELKKQRLADLKTENEMLKDKNEELTATLLNLSLQRSDVLSQGDDVPLAEEMRHFNEKELMTSLKKERKKSARLHAYIESILLKIIEHDPKLLEIGF